GPVPGHGGGSLGRLVVGVGVHGEHPERGRRRGIHGGPRYRRRRRARTSDGPPWPRLTRQAVATYTSWSVIPPVQPLRLAPPRPPRPPTPPPCSPTPSSPA